MECVELSTWLFARVGSVRHVLVATLIVPELLLHASAPSNEIILAPAVAAAAAANGSAGTTLSVAALSKNAMLVAAASTAVARSPIRPSRRLLRRSGLFGGGGGGGGGCGGGGGGAMTLHGVDMSDGGSTVGGQSTVSMSVRSGMCVCRNECFLSYLCCSVL
jgi:hypothetical protein